MEENGGYQNGVSSELNYKNMIEYNILIGFFESSPGSHNEFNSLAVNCKLDEPAEFSIWQRGWQHHRRRKSAAITA